MERADIHPSREELGAYCNKSLDPASEKRLTSHLAECEFCSEIIQQYQEFERTGKEIDEWQPSAQAQKAAINLYRKLFRGESYQLGSRLHSEHKRYHLAADSPSAERALVENLATVFNEDPEMVLKIMRDNRSNRTYLHLASDNEALFSHVLVEAPTENKSYVTDDSGIANIDDADSFNIMSAKWQVKLPEAEFTLQPLKIEPDRTEYQSETVLDSDRGDKIKLIFEGKGNGKLIKVEVLSLNGVEPNTPFIAAISLNETTTTHRSQSGKPILVNVDKLPVSIQIRLYR